MTNLFQRFSLLLLLFVLSIKYTLGQCPLPVVHTSGTAQVGCTEVTVTSAGFVMNVGGPVLPCGYGPFGVGVYGDGSYTFTFSPAVAGVSIDVDALDNHITEIEEMTLDINGGFYPITDPGVPDGCFDPAIIWPPGTLRADPTSPNGWGSTSKLTVTKTIFTLTISRSLVTGIHSGINVSLSICCPICETNAGEITSIPLDLCPGDLALISPAEQTVLDNDDLLQYILFSDLADTLGSIINTNSTPEFAFNPATMQFGISYYIAAIAGNNLGGNVDLNDPCLDISNAIEVVWHLPTVMFSTPNADACPGNCHYIEVSFTGTPPFQLSGEVVSGANIVSAFTQTYLDYSGILTVCLPPDTALGSLDVNATELTDANCTCD